MIGRHPFPPPDRYVVLLCDLSFGIRVPVPVPVRRRDQSRLEGAPRLHGLAGRAVCLPSEMDPEADPW